MRYLLALTLLASPAWAQTAADVAALDVCQAKSLTVKVDSPIRVKGAQEEAFQNCLVVAIPDPQRRTLTLRKSREAGCNLEAENEVKRDSLTPAAERDKIYARCLKRHGYVQ